MGANALVQTRIDGRIKREAAAVLEAIGLDGIRCRAAYAYAGSARKGAAL